MIRGVFFDVGGTLFSYRNLPAAMSGLVQTLAKKLELQHEPKTLLAHYVVAHKEADRVYAEKPAYLFRDYFETVFLNWLDRIESRHLHAHFDWVEALHREQMIGCIVLQEDCHAMLDQLKAMGLYLSVVSNADENQLRPLVERGQLERWMTHWTSSEAAGSCKPDRRFFERALEKSGLEANEVLFVGDSLEQDIQGAHAVGMTTVLITEPGIPTPMAIGRNTPEPDFRINRLMELPPIVERLRRAAP